MYISPAFPPLAVLPKPMAQSASFFRFCCQFPLFQQLSMGLLLAEEHTEACNNTEANKIHAAPVIEAEADSLKAIIPLICPVFATGVVVSDSI